MRSAGSALSVGIGGGVQVCCIHGREKRQNVDQFEFTRPMFAQLCPCCENLFAYQTDEPHYCEDCGGRVVPGSEHLPKGK